MAASSSNSWMPAAGRYDAQIGSSLGRALKARRGIAMNNKMPAKDFYALRYNFMPESVDPAKPGTIEVKRTKESASVTVERASVQSGETGHSFVGTETIAKEWECVLIYDEEMGTFTLEKLDAYVGLTYDRRTPSGPRHPGSRASGLPTRDPSSHSSAALPQPARPSPSVASRAQQINGTSSRTQSALARSAADELEAALLEDEDAEGEPDDDFEALPTEPVPPPPPKKPSATTQDKKPRPKPAYKGAASVKSAPPPPKDDDDDSEGPLARMVGSRPKQKAAATSAPKATQAKTKSKAVNIMMPQKPRQKPVKAAVAAAPVVPAPPKPTPAPKAVAGVKRARQPEEEHFALSLPTPAPPPKRKRPSPPPAPPPKPKAPVSLALPGPEGVSLPGSSLALPEPLPASQQGAESSDDDDYWDNALADVHEPPTSSVAPIPLSRIVMEEIVPTANRRHSLEEPHQLSSSFLGEDGDGEEDDDFLEREMARQMEMDLEEEEEPDFLADAIASSEQGPPMSWNAAAGGGDAGLWDEDDETSSSDDSDDD